MKALIDTNVLLDVLEKRSPFFEDSFMIWKLCEVGLLDGYISALSFPNIVYIMRKDLTASQIDDIFQKLAIIFNFVPLTSQDLKRSSTLCWKDFEDALQYITAKNLDANFIISRNVSDFEDSNIPTICPHDFLTLNLFSIYKKDPLQ